MRTFSNIITYSWLVIAGVGLFEGFSNLGNPDKNVYFYFGISVVAVFMFFFRRKYMKRFRENMTKK